MEFDELSNRVIGCAIEVHRCLGPGLLESTCEQCLVYEMSTSQIPLQLQLSLPVQYNGVNLDCGYRMDFLVAGSFVLELKRVERVLRIDEAQLLTYMKLSRIKIGLLINFNAELLKDGIKRFVL